jgi:hypothetical protein
MFGYLFVAVFMPYFSACALATINVTGGNLHVFETDGGMFTSAPPDKPFVAPSTTNTAIIGVNLGEGGAQETVSFIGGQIHLSSLTVYTTGPTNGTNASGTLNITEDAFETMWVRMDPQPNEFYYQSTISLDAVGGENVFARTFGLEFQPRLDFLVPLNAGQYVLSWNTNGAVQFGHGGPGEFDFVMGVPEPSSLLLLAVAAMGMMGRRKKR